MRFFSLLSIFLLLTSFFWTEDEEKKLRQLHQNAESAMQSQDFEAAKKAYKELIGNVGISSGHKYKVNWPTYIDLIIRFAEACEASDELDEGEKALSKLLLRNPPTEFLPKIQLMRVRLTSHNKSAEETYLELKNIESISPLAQWQRENVSFFHALQYSLDSYYDSLVQKAKRYRVTGYYKEAISLYREILEAIEQRAYPKANLRDSLIPKQIRYRLAESYFRQANYEQTLSLVGQSHNIEDQVDQEMIYLAALCFREKQEYEKALDLFQRYANCGNRDDLDHYDHALFEIGLSYYRSRNPLNARNYFERLLTKNGKKGKPNLLAALYLARTYLEEENFNKVESILASLEQDFSTQTLLRYEFFFLRGEAAYSRNEYATAKEFFEHSLPPNQLVGRWIEQAKYHLGLCCMTLGDEALRSQKERMHFFEKAESIFEKLLLSSEREGSLLALAQLHLLYDKYHLESEALKKVETLLSNVDETFSLLGQHEALMLRAEAAPTYEIKERFYRRATSPSFQACPKYAEAWYVRAVNHFQEGLKHEGRYFDLAVSSFEQAFRLIEKSDLNKAAQILKLEAKANFYRNSPIASLSLIEKLLSQFNESVEQREETLYLRGLIASRLAQIAHTEAKEAETTDSEFAENSSYFHIAEKSLMQVSSEYPKGQHKDDALYVLGTLYYYQEDFEKAKTIFLELAQHHPKSSFAPEAWFWAAEASERLKEEAAQLRGQVYELYPTSSRAAEAYFRQYSYEAYLEGQSDAMAHLNDFSRRFPKSPLLVVVQYLIGKNIDDFDGAKTAFEEALKSFQCCLEEGKIPEVPYIYFRYLTMLELASLHLTYQAELNYAQKLLQSIVIDFCEEGHPLTSALKLKTSYPSLFEKSEYSLVQCYLKLGKTYKAQKRLSIMLSHYEEAGINEGYHLAQVWKEQGNLALQCNDFETALRCFEIAEECGKESLPDEQKLALWISKSQCYRGKNDYDAAMRLLSKVINADIISPLRVKAMFQRAEIYEEQERPELALRQLEATAKKGGEWAWQAKEKLRVNYGME